MATLVKPWVQVQHRVNQTHTLTVLETGKHRQEDEKFKVILGYIERLSLGYMRPWEREAG